MIANIRAHLAQTGRTNVALMLEHLTDNRFEAIDDTNQIGADGCWLDPFMFKSFEFARSGNIDGEILRILNSGMDYARGKGPVIYIENHDHSTVMREAGGRSRWFKTQPPAISLLTSPGIVLLHNGQEFGEDILSSFRGSGPCPTQAVAVEHSRWRFCRTTVIRALPEADWNPPGASFTPDFQFLPISLQPSRRIWKFSGEGRRRLSPIRSGRRRRRTFHYRHQLFRFRPVHRYSVFGKRKVGRSAERAERDGRELPDAKSEDQFELGTNLLQ